MFLNNQEKNHSLRLINLGNNIIINETSVDIRKVRILANQTYIVYFLNAVLDIETKNLELNNSYSCCVGIELNNFACSILRFENYSTISFESNNIIKDIKLFNSKIRSIEKILWFTCTGFLSIIFFLFIYIIKIKGKRSTKKTDEELILPSQTNNLFSIETKLKQNDLYQQYNLQNESYSKKILNIDCNECPPSYEELSKVEETKKF